MNAVFIDRGAGQPLMTGVAVKYKSQLRVFAATLASSRQTNGMGGGLHVEPYVLHYRICT